MEDCDWCQKWHSVLGLLYRDARNVTRANPAKSQKKTCIGSQSFSEEQLYVFGDGQPKSDQNKRVHDLLLVHTVDGLISCQAHNTSLLSVLVVLGPERSSALPHLPPRSLHSVFDSSFIPRVCQKKATKER